MDSKAVVAWAWSFAVKVVLLLVAIYAISLLTANIKTGVALGILVGIVYAKLPNSKALGVIRASYRMKRAEIAARREHEAH